MLMHNGRELLTLSQTAERAGVSLRTVYKWLNEGRLEYVRNPGGAVRIYADCLYNTADRRQPAY